MPELPEVEVITRGARPHLLGLKIHAITSSGKKLRQPIPIQKMNEVILNQSIREVSRRAKFMEVHFSSGSMLIFHFGMTGNIGIFDPASPPARHDHLQFLLSNGSELRFNDTRRFGMLHCLNAEESTKREETIYHTMGPEPFSDIFTGDYLFTLARTRTAPVKNFIMDSRVVVGVGNIYANEALFAAGIAPAQASGSLRLVQWQQLSEKVREVLAHAIQCGGSTISDFINTNGESGYFQMNFKVYGHEGAPCPQCSTPITRSVIGGRASFSCPRCQAQSTGTG